mmetsp:Transcript_14508/g.41216  ORF Transcript_14508/g.41216 Transcript_14508/m.41216 type:complete len:215 (-) Transcript_14508:244-888(-)
MSGMTVNRPRYVAILKQLPSKANAVSFVKRDGLRMQVAPSRSLRSSTHPSAALRGTLNATGRSTLTESKGADARLFTPISIPRHARTKRSSPAQSKTARAFFQLMPPPDSLSTHTAMASSTTTGGRGRRKSDLQPKRSARSPPTISPAELPAVLDAVNAASTMPRLSRPYASIIMATPVGMSKEAPAPCSSRPAHSQAKLREVPQMRADTTLIA